MTISYQLDVSAASAIAFFRLLFRWKGSIWKIVYEELLVWTVLYLIVEFIYRSDYVLNDHQKMYHIFRELALYLNTRLDYIPLTFILGFFVSSIISRWSEIFYNMGYVESQAIFVSNYVRGDDRETRLLRRAMARYICLTQALVFRDISVRVRKRFPTYDRFATAEEMEKLKSIKLKYDKYWAPTNWIYTLIFRARREGKISHDILASKLCDEIKFFRYNLQMVCNYDWVPLPLVYPQAVFLAVYVYFGICLISRQFIPPDQQDALNKSSIDLYLPVMTMIQFFFFIGWVKVAQGLLNPFGTDDDDFECNYLLDKNLATSMCIVDDEYGNPPEVIPDKFWRKEKDYPVYDDAPSTAADHPLIGSAVNAKY
uniref:Bestrophin homolog n=1 Tax=Syphacia muris TaxID=451379 RepID=A0A0N5AJV9_9BILA